MEPQQPCFYSQLFSLSGLHNKQQEDKVQLSVCLPHAGDCRVALAGLCRADISLILGPTAVEL